MAKLLSDLVLPAFQGIAYALLTLLIRLHAAWRALAALCAAAAARLAAAAPALRPLLATLCVLPQREHLGSGPRPPTVLGVAIAEDLSDAGWPAAIEALGQLLAWAHDGGFQLMLLYEPGGRLQQQPRLRQLELQLLQRRLVGAVRLQVGWQQQQRQQQQQQKTHSGAGGDSSAPAVPPGQSSLTVVLLAAADGQWPLLSAAAARAGAAAAACTGASGEDTAAAAIDAAIAAPARVRQRIQSVAGPLAGAEPDFVLVTGPSLSTAGFPAWALRTAEVYPVGPLEQLGAAQLTAAVRRFCTTKQRFGK